jgi:hypothetical protein
MRGELWAPNTRFDLCAAGLDSGSPPAFAGVAKNDGITGKRDSTLGDAGEGKEKGRGREVREKKGF